MRIWTEHDKDTAYAPVSRILEGITAEQAGTLAVGLPHSIYQELWHLATWQNLVISKDQKARQRWEERRFPSMPTPPVDTDWQELVRTFMDDLERGERMRTPQPSISPILRASRRGRRSKIWPFTTLIISPGSWRSGNC